MTFRYRTARDLRIGTVSGTVGEYVEGCKPLHRPRRILFAMGRLAKGTTIAVAVCWGLFLGGCVVEPVSIEPREIMYKVSGTASSASIMYTNESNGTGNERSGYASDGKMAVWRKTVRLRPGQMAYVTAQNTGYDAGTVIVEILSQGGVHKRSESSGEHCIATVSGLVQHTRPD